MAALRGHRRVRGPRCARLHFRRKSSRFSFVQVLHLRTCLLSPPCPSYSGRKEGGQISLPRLRGSLAAVSGVRRWMGSFCVIPLFVGGMQCKRAAGRLSFHLAANTHTHTHTHIIALAKEAGFLEHVDFNRPAPLVTSAISFRPPDFPLFFLLCMPRSNP